MLTFLSDVCKHCFRIHSDYITDNDSCWWAIIFLYTWIQSWYLSHLLLQDMITSYHTTEKHLNKLFYNIYMY